MMLSINPMQITSVNAIAIAALTLVIFLLHFPDVARQATEINLAVPMLDYFHLLTTHRTHCHKPTSFIVFTLPFFFVSANRANKFPVLFYHLDLATTTNCHYYFPDSQPARPPAIASKPAIKPLRVSVLDNLPSSVRCLSL